MNIPPKYSLLLLVQASRLSGSGNQRTFEPSSSVEMCVCLSLTPVMQVVLPATDDDVPCDRVEVFLSPQPPTLVQPRDPLNPATPHLFLYSIFKRAIYIPSRVLSFCLSFLTSPQSKRPNLPAHPTLVGRLHAPKSLFILICSRRRTEKGYFGASSRTPHEKKF